MQRGKFILKTQFKLNKEEEHKPVYDLDYWDAEPSTIPKHVKEQKEEKDYSHMFFKTTPEGSIPHPDRHTIKPEGAVNKMTSKEVIEVLQEDMKRVEDGEDNQIIDI